MERALLSCKQIGIINKAKKKAVWCNSNTIGSWSIDKGANPWTAQYKGYSLIGKASCSW
jgi:hypothetical protein